MRDQNTRTREINRAELPVEFMMNVLRMNEGVENAHFGCRTGLSLEGLEPALSQSRKQNLINAHRLSLTEFGRNHLNSVVQLFFKGPM